VRTHRELWLWLGGLFLTLFAFLTVIAVSYFAKEPRYSLFGNPWMPTALLSFLIAFAAFFAAARSWPFPSVVKPGFPDITLDILSIGSTDTEHESSSGLDEPAHLRSFHVRITSAEQERIANLTAIMYVKLVAGSWGRAGEAVCPPLSWALPSSLGLSPMSMPVEVAPGQAVSGQLIFEIPRYYLERCASPVAGRLEITDQASDKRVSIAAELGHYDKTTMTATPGGAEILGPEFDNERQLDPGKRPHPVQGQP
jgi:hypothetical protein